MCKVPISLCALYRHLYWESFKGVVPTVITFFLSSVGTILLLNKCTFCFLFLFCVVHFCYIFSALYINNTFCFFYFVFFILCCSLLLYFLCALYKQQCAKPYNLQHTYMRVTNKPDNQILYIDNSNVTSSYWGDHLLLQVGGGAKEKEPSAWHLVCKVSVLLYPVRQT